MRTVRIPLRRGGRVSSPLYLALQLPDEAGPVYADRWSTAPGTAVLTVSVAPDGAILTVVLRHGNVASVQETSLWESLKEKGAKYEIVPA